MATELREKLGRRIQKLRKEKGLSQEKFSELVGISPSAMSSIETGKSFMSFANLEKTMEVLDIKPHNLFTFDNNDVLYTDLIKKIENIKDNQEILFILSLLTDVLSNKSQ